MEIEWTLPAELKLRNVLDDSRYKGHSLEFLFYSKKTVNINFLPAEKFLYKDIVPWKPELAVLICQGYEK